MKLKMIMSAALALALSALSASACLIQIRVACPNDKTAAGIRVWVETVGNVYTDNLGVATATVQQFGTYNICVDTATLPAGATLNKNCQKLNVVDPAPPVVEFVLGGPFCETPPPPGPCWLTGGGQVGKVTKGVGDYSFGGVVYPGCSPKAADGGNWNVVDHATGLHFQGQQIIVDSCSGVSTRSPKVSVNIIDFHGLGIIDGIAGNPQAQIPVSFVGRAIDNLDGGSGSDQLYIQVLSGATVMLQIGNSAADPATISTGNLQIHQSSCN
jgi:hypothetical protein